MTVTTELLPTPLPGLRALRWATDALHTGVKEVYAVALVERGRSAWLAGGNVWESGPGSLQILAPGDVHRDLSRDGPTSVQVVSFPARRIAHVVGGRTIEAHLAPHDPRGEAFRRLHAAVRHCDDRLALEVAFEEAIAAFGAIERTTTSHSRAVRRAIEVLRARADTSETVTLDELAAHAGLDKFRLCRAFRAQVGLPPHAYLVRLRVMRAKELLASGVRPSDAATRAGFYDQSQLNRHFRRLVGTTPRSYADGVRDDAAPGAKGARFLRTIASTTARG